MKQVILIISALWSLSAFAQETLTIKDAISITLENNFDIRIAEKNLEVDANNVSIGNAGMLPSLNLNATQNYTVNNPKQEFITGQINERTNARSKAWNSGASLDWTLFDGLKMFTTYQKLEQMQHMGMLEVQRQVETNVKLVMDQFYELVNIGDKIRFQDSSLAYSKERLEIAQRAFDLGTRSKVEVLQARVDLNADSSAMLSLEEQWEAGLVNLKRLMGVEMQNDYAIDGEINVEDTVNYSTLRSQILNQNTRLRMQHVDRSISSYEVEELKRERWPTLSFNTGYNYDRSQSEAGFLLSNRVYGYSYGLTARWSLFNGFNQQRRIENARIGQEIADLNYEKTEQYVLGDFETAYQRYLSALRKYQFENDNLELARENLSLAKERYDLGNLSGIEYREIQQQYFDAQERLLDAEYQALRYQLELKLLGGELVELE